MDPGEGRREGGSAALRGEGGAGDGDWKQHLQEAINRVPTPDAQRALDFARLRLGGQLEVTKDQLNEQYNRAIAKQGRLPHVLLHFVLRHCNGGEFTHPDLLASYIRGLLEFSRDPPLTGDEVREKVIQYFEKRVLPHLKSVENDSVNQLDTMQKVINFSVLDLLDQDPRKPHWDDIYELYQEDFSAATGRNDPTLCELGNRLDRFCRGFITIDAILSSCSFGVFFRMPSWLADFDYDIIQRSPSVQAELYALGYWSFDMIEGPETSLICGYNIGEPPPEAAEHADSKEKRDLVDDMSREYHSCAHVSQERQTKFASVGGARGIDDDVPLVHGDSANISEAPEDDQTLSRVLEGMTLSIVADDEFRREAVQGRPRCGAGMEKYDAGLAAIVAAQQARDAGDVSEARMKFVEGIVRISKVALLQACGSAAACA